MWPCDTHDHVAQQFVVDKISWNMIGVKPYASVVSVSALSLVMGRVSNNPLLPLTHLFYKLRYYLHSVLCVWHIPRPEDSSDPLTLGRPSESKRDSNFLDKLLECVVVVNYGLILKVNVIRKIWWQSNCINEYSSKFILHNSLFESQVQSGSLNHTLIWS